MLKEEIVVGKSYVNEGSCIIREVVEEVDRRSVRYHSFELNSGRLLPARHQVCARGELARWADREAEPGEMARIHPYEADVWLGADSESPQRPMGLEEAHAELDKVPGPHTFAPPK